CQRMVKDELVARGDVTSANSISLSRLLPQLTYYASSALEVQQLGKGPANYVVPTGNLGNALACVMARDMGLPIERIVLAATAHPAKFETVVEPLIGRTVEPPAPLRALLDRPSRAEPLEARTLALLAQI